MSILANLGRRSTVHPAGPFWAACPVLAGLLIPIANAQATRPLGRATRSTACSSSGPLGAKGQESPPDELLTFEEGMFTSRACLQHRYDPVPYWVRHDADGLHSRAGLDSPENGAIQLEGVPRRRDGPCHRVAEEAAMVTYTVLRAIPFMPATEIGLGVLMIFGGRLAFLVHANTLASFLVSYAIGRLFPPCIMARTFATLGFPGTSAFIDRLLGLLPSGRLALLVRDSPTRLLPIAIRHSIPALAILRNVPGNVALGGGGGIALAAGMSRMSSFPIYALTVASAAAPVPLILFLTQHAWM